MTEKQEKNRLVSNVKAYHKHLSKEVLQEWDISKLKAFAHPTARENPKLMEEFRL